MFLVDVRNDEQLKWFMDEAGKRRWKFINFVYEFSTGRIRYMSVKPCGPLWILGWIYGQIHLIAA